MRLYEFQAKRIFAECDIPIPESALLTSASDSLSLAPPVVLKAQVPVGGRGKAGGIRTVDQVDEIATTVNALLNLTIKDHPVQAILAEKKSEIIREIYLAVLLDKLTNQPLVMASASGGVDVEQIAREAPERIVRQHVDPFIGLQPYTVRYLAKALKVDDLAGFGHILRQMYAILQIYEATLVEINPLAETSDGLLALDAKVELDDKAAFRHGEPFATLRQEQETLDETVPSPAEKLAQARDITYVLLDGDVGLIADGAGTGMLTLDLIQDAGGRPANFCEMGGLADASVMRESIEVVLANRNVKALLITLIGGLTRMDHMADGIVAYLRQQTASVPMVIRMCGTREEVGKATLRTVGVETFDDLPEAVEKVVALTRTQSA